MSFNLMGRMTCDTEGCPAVKVIPVQLAIEEVAPGQLVTVPVPKVPDGWVVRDTPRLSLAGQPVPQVNRTVVCDECGAREALAGG